MIEDDHTIRVDDIAILNNPEAELDTDIKVNFNSPNIELLKVYPNKQTLLSKHPEYFI